MNIKIFLSTFASPIVGAHPTLGGGCESVDVPFAGVFKIGNRGSEGSLTGTLDDGGGGSTTTGKGGGGTYLK